MPSEADRAKLVALADALDRFIHDQQASYPEIRATRNLRVWRKDVEHFYEIYKGLLERLKSEDPSSFDLLPERAASSLDAAPDPHFGPRTELKEVLTLLRDVRHCLGLIPAAPVQVAMAVTREGVFFAGQRTDAMKLILDIVGAARTKLEVIDGYIDLGTLSLLIKEPTLRVEVLTKPLDSTITAAIAALAKGKHLEVRSTSAFHDRFVCVDGGDVYHFGASLKDAGGRGFMFSRIEEPGVLRALKTEWAQEWASAKVVV